MFIRNAWYVAAWSSEVTVRPLALHAALAATFDEDSVILEAQHASLKARPEPLLSTAHDQARVLAERKLDEWLAAEAAATAQVGA